MALCSDCEQFDLQSFRSDSYMQRGYAYQDVKKRASNCDFCGLLQTSFNPKSSGLAGHTSSNDRSQDQNWWIHLELLGRDRKRICKGDGEHLGVAFIRAFLGVRYAVRTTPSRPQTWSEYPQGQEVLLGICADEGMLYHTLSLP
jgi:hypothetical protein